MSRFYLTMSGGKSNSQTVTRRAYGGAEVNVASYNGAINVAPYVKDGKDYVRVARVPWQNSGGPSVVIYDGPFDVADNYSTDLK